MAEILHVTPQTAADYERQFPTRLSINDLEEDGITSLMFRCDGGVGPEAYVAPVLVEGFKRNIGSTGLTVCFLNQDMKPIGYRAPSEVRRDIWFPEEPYPLVSPDRSTDTKTTHGYFLPYVGEFYDDVAADLEELYETITFGSKPVPIGWVTRNKFQE